MSESKVKDSKDNIKKNSTKYIKYTNDCINIPDKNLKKALKKCIHKMQDYDLTKDRLETIEYLSINNMKITNLEGLQYCKNLIELDASINRITDIKPLLGLKKLKRLDLYDNKIIDIRALENLNELEYISLSCNRINSIKVLGKLKKLTYLALGENRLNDIQEIKELTNLSSLFLSYNTISNIEPLRGLKKLEWIGLDDNRICDATPLGDIENLTNIHIHNNKIILDKQEIVNETLSIENPIKDIRGIPISPNEISNDGVYNSKKNILIWNKSLENLSHVEFKFNNSYFSGAVIVPIKNIVLKPKEIEEKNIDEGFVDKVASTLQFISKVFSE
ncbi:MAG: hypothetical protein E7214_14605 [Clostridium sp.]|nr:hypothetical protein [Clostridium sp.]